ncbi:hypothetical protein [Roseibium suaedae]|uniref:Uncharacterized protein n=1 Tax=Roseibium suaedae TaxID=735517 RepID=A0A1M7P7E1_9HYPH|nr:hypothetical protein [Roseibium suaedae]SHN12546.1 hypothetical protein SAMN05444272_4167 [Roseibium suaedae]
MYFNVYNDGGAILHGYLIPDGFSAKPSIVVRSAGEEVYRAECDVFLENTYQHRHHETGIVGFILNEKKIPGLKEMKDLEISDANTGFTFYRRFQEHLHIEKRVFRLETQFAPHSELDQSLRSNFQFYACNVEHFGSESVRQTLEIVNQKSTYVSGRVLIKNVQQYFTDDTLTITSVRDPFYELAIRLTTISHYKTKPFSFISERDKIFYEPAISHFHGMNITDEADVRARFKSAPKDVLGLFESPFTHQLVASSPTDDVSRDSVASALDMLSQFSIFNSNEKDAQLATDIGETLGVDPDQIRFNPTQSLFEEVAAIFRNVPTIEHILEKDLILYHFIREAEKRTRSKRNPAHVRRR